MQVTYHRPAIVIRTSIGHAAPRLGYQEDMIPAVNAMGGRARWLPEQAAAEGGTTSQRVRPPASIALDRGYGIPAAIGRQNEGPTGPLMWVTGSAVARRMPWVDPSSA